MNAAIKKSEASENELDDYTTVITKKVLNKLSKLSGKDEQKYIQKATSAANAKIDELKNKKPSFSELTVQLTDVYELAEEKDNDVSTKISELAEPYKEPFSLSSLVRGAKGFVYNLFCVDLAGIISDYLPFGDVLMNASRKASNTVSHWRDDVKYFFTHGDGKYIKNIVSSALKVVGAALAIAAVALASSTVLAIIGVIAGGIYLIYCLGNFMATTESNATALEQSRNGNTGLAHYYGGVSKVSEWTKKNDFGGAETNIWIDFAGGCYEVIGQTSKVVRDIVAIAVFVDSLFEVPDPAGMTKGSQADFDKFKGKLSKEQLNNPKTQEYLSMREGKLHSTHIDHEYTWSNFKSNFLRQRYQSSLDAGNTFNYYAKKDKSIPVTNPSQRINVGKLLFGSDKKILSNIGSDDPIKRYKGFKSGFSMVFDFVTGEKSSTIQNIETIESFINKPSKYDVGKFVSSIISGAGGRGLGEVTGTFIEPFTDFGKDLSSLVKLGS